MASDALKQNNEGFKNGTKREVVSTSVVIEIVFTCERVKRCASGRGSCNTDGIKMLFRRIERKLILDETCARNKRKRDVHARTFLFVFLCHPRRLKLLLLLLSLNRFSRYVTKTESCQPASASAADTVINGKTSKRKKARLAKQIHSVVR